MEQDYSEIVNYEEIFESDEEVEHIEYKDANLNLTDNCDMQEIEDPWKKICILEGIPLEAVKVDWVRSVENNGCKKV